MNAKQEFIDHIENRSVLCADILLGSRYDDITDQYLPNEIQLKLDYSESDYVEFLKKLNVEYDSGFGGQELFGIIWYTDETWSERDEYDGSEWWDYKSRPDIPDELKCN